jgi:hypothetical protein
MDAPLDIEEHRLPFALQPDIEPVERHLIALLERSNEGGPSLDLLDQVQDRVRRNPARRCRAPAPD